MVTRANDRKQDVVSDLRGGKGDVARQHLVLPEDSCGKFKMCCVLTLEPGVSIGEHAHVEDAEFCYMLEGELTITDNGKECKMHPGDAWYCGGGAFHSSRNDSDKPVVFMAIVVE